MTDRHDFHGDMRKVGHNKHKVHIEFVAIPSYFNIENYLSIREITGMFMHHEITLESVNVICNAVRESPIFILSSPTGKYTASSLFFIDILKQLKLQINGFSNFNPTNIKSYENILKHSNFSDEHGNPIIDMTIVFINLYKCVEEGILEPIIKSVLSVEEYHDEIQKTAQMFKS